MHIKKSLIKVLTFLIDSIRPILGPAGCCIYHPITCRQYAKYTLEQKPIYLAIPLIVLRFISCNPITALYLRIKFKISKN